VADDFKLDLPEPDKCLLDMIETMSRRQRRYCRRCGRPSLAPQGLCLACRSHSRLGRTPQDWMDIIF
jgi:hypothetical protein